MAGFYILVAKENQPTLTTDLALFPSPTRPLIGDGKRARPGTRHMAVSNIVRFFVAQTSMNGSPSAGEAWHRCFVCNEQPLCSKQATCESLLCMASAISRCRKLPLCGC